MVETERDFMQVFFKNAKMAKVAADMKALTREYGQSGKWIAKCLNALRAAPNLAELFKPFFRSFRCHLLHNLTSETPIGFFLSLNRLCLKRPMAALIWTMSKPLW